MAAAPTADHPPASTGPELAVQQQQKEMVSPTESSSSSIAAGAGAGAAAAAASGGPGKLPLPAPLPASVPAERPALTADQQAKYDWLLAQVRGWTDVAVPKDAERSGPLADDERLWLTRECLLRYLRATKWHEHEAERRLRDTVAWRREYGVGRLLTPEHIGPENATGKQVLLGYDKQGRPCHYLNPGRQNTEPSPRQVQHLVYMVERVVDLMPAGQETLALLINFKSSKSRSNTAPGIHQGREVLHILQTHYPERLGRALIINVPWVVWGFFKLITPFIDPHTREKLKFNEDMSQYVPKETLWSEFSTGEYKFDYDHDVYWPALTKLCDERRAARTARWVAGGKHIGELEDYLAGHLEKGIGGDVAAATVAGPADAPAAVEAVAPEIVEGKEAESTPPTSDVKVDAIEEKLKEVKVAA